MFMPAEDQKSGDGVVLQPNHFEDFLGMFARGGLVLCYRCRDSRDGGGSLVRRYVADVGCLFNSPEVGSGWLCVIEEE
jgi:hypothetical protein